MNKKNYYLTALIILHGFLSLACTNNDDHRIRLQENKNVSNKNINIKINYLNQEPPGRTPQPFGSDFFQDGIHSTPVFSPDGKELYWSTYYKPAQASRSQHIFVSHFDGKNWSAAEVVSFSGQYNDGGPFLSSDGKKLFFYSNRPINDLGKPTDEYISDIWFVGRKGENWVNPQRLDFNTDKHEGMLSVSNNGTLYFMSNRKGCKGIYDIFVAGLINGTFSSPVNIGSPISTSGIENSPFIAADESFIIFSYAAGAPAKGLHISFKLENGKWSRPIRLNAEINKPGAVHRFPGISPDGKYFFFSREAGGKRKIFWVLVEEVIKKDF